MLRSLLLLWICSLPSFALADSTDSRQGQVYFFHFQGCIPCAKMRPIVRELQEAGLPLVSVDKDEYPLLVNQYHIAGYPTFVSIRDGREVGRIIGLTTRERLEALARGKQFSQRGWAALGRVSVFTNSGASHGSGTLVHNDGQHGIVLTNWHVVNDPGRLVVSFPEKNYPGKVLRADRTNDVALVLIDSPDCHPVPLSAVDAVPGETLALAGYKEDGELHSSQGTVTQINYSSDDGTRTIPHFSISGEARQGDSGGPILNRRGNVMGVLYGAGEGVTMATKASYCRKFLADALSQSSLVTQ
jgi:S1-C subfamily serine protease